MPNTSSVDDLANCYDSNEVTVYRGETFTVQLMAADDQCFPSAELVQANSVDRSFSIDRGALIKAGKVCQKMNLSVTGKSLNNKTTIELKFIESLNDHAPALNLTVNLKECPIGFESISKGKCLCGDVVESYEIT